MSIEAIDEVIDRLGTVVEEARAERSRIDYFAAMYRRVTVAVREAIVAGEFEDPVRMAQLDLVFAERYLDAYAAWRTGDAATESWQICFDAAGRWRPLILQHLLAGMSAHINLDLGVAAATVAPGGDLAELRNDFDTINDVLASTPLQIVTGIRDNLVVAVMSGTRRLSGWTAPQSLLADRVYPHLSKVGPAALIGLSNDVPSTSHIPGAAREARLALDFASVSARVMPYARIPFRQMLLSVARDEIQSSLPPWLDVFRTADDKSRGALSATLGAYADASMNVMKAAEALTIHPNTIYARMQKIERLTGRNPLEYHALTELLLIVECAYPDAPAGRPG